MIEIAGPESRSLETRRLWSLWDMNNFFAADFLLAVDRVATLSQALHDQARSRGADAAKWSLQNDPDALVDLRAANETLLKTCAELNLPAAIDAAQNLKTELQRNSIRAGDVQYFMREIVNRSRTEMQSRLFLSLSADEAAYFAPQTPLFGADFANKFASTGAYDLDEAAKCLALERSTAAVFHLMKIMEVGLHALYHCVGCTDPLVGNDRNWGSILNAVNAAITARGKQWSKKDQFQELHALLVAVKDAWRNSVMHVDKKYTPEEAKLIFQSVRGFMSKIAALMDESGTPRA